MSRRHLDTPSPLQPPVAQRDLELEVAKCVGGVITATWGAGCVAVDPWYGLQTDTDPVKEIGVVADQTFFTALPTWGPMKSVRTFAVGQLTRVVKLP